jgi:hypothetical protein
MSKNVLIPQRTLERIIEMMECPDFSRFPYLLDYLDILRELKLKMQKIQLRETYSNIVRADNDNSSFEARMEYLVQKRQLGNVDVGYEDF